MLLVNLIQLSDFHFILSLSFAFQAAIKGEQWRKAEEKAEAKASNIGGVAITQPPSRPPPRAPNKQTPTDDETYINTGGLNQV